MGEFGLTGDGAFAAGEGKVGAAGAGKIGAGAEAGGTTACGSGAEGGAGTGDWFVAEAGAAAEEDETCKASRSIRPAAMTTIAEAIKVARRLARGLSAD